MTRMHRLTRRTLIGLALAAAAAGAHAQSYPDRPLQLIVPWGAGGGTDAVARMIASLMEKDLGQPVNVVNRTGGSGVVGHAAIAGAPPSIGSSPIPLAPPPGPKANGASTRAVQNGGASSAVGMM